VESQEKNIEKIKNIHANKNINISN
jgi:hypothetical protein